MKDDQLQVNLYKATYNMSEHNTANSTTPRIYCLVRVVGSYREAMVAIVKAIQHNLYYTVVHLVNNDLRIS